MLLKGIICPTVSDILMPSLTLSPGLAKAVVAASSCLRAGHAPSVQCNKLRPPGYPGCLEQGCGGAVSGSSYAQHSIQQPQDRAWKSRPSVFPQGPLQKLNIWTIKKIKGPHQSIWVPSCASPPMSGCMGCLGRGGPWRPFPEPLSPGEQSSFTSWHCLALPRPRLCQANIFPPCGPGKA